MKKTFIILTSMAVLFVISPDLFSQVPGFLSPLEYDKHICVSHEACRKYHNHEFFQAKGEPLIRNYDVIRYDLYLDWYETLLYGKHDSAFFGGVQTVLIKLDSNDVKRVEFDAVDMVIDSVSAGEIRLLGFNYDGRILSVNFSEAQKIDEEISIAIYFRVMRDYNWGFNVYQKGELDMWGRTYDIKENIAYTFGQPEVSRYWMPCNDHPHDKALSSIAIRVPYEYTALSNGWLDSIVHSEYQEYKIFYYNSREPISTYLMVAVASVYKHFSDEYLRITDPGDRVPINYYVWQSDYDGDFSQGSPYDAKRSLQLNPEMLRLFSGTFGEFPYDRYGIVAIEPVWYGGMEHPNMVTINRQWLRGQGEIGLAHEAAHQWIGNLITCETWQDIWINEGGASWCEAIWYEYRHQDSNQYRFLISNHGRHYLNHPQSWRVAVWGIPSDSVFIHSRVSYSKAAFIYNMLHYYFGRENFFAFMRQLMADNHFGTVSTKKFEDALADYFSDDESFVREFFRNWLYSPGHPTYRIEYDISPKDEGTYGITLEISQVHNNANYPEVYISRVPLLFYKDGEVLARYYYLHNKRTHSITYGTHFIPDSVVIDRSEVLYHLQPGMTSVRSGLSGLTGLLLSPNPVQAGSNIGLEFELLHSTNTLIRMYDDLGRIVLEQDGGYLEYGKYNIQIPAMGISSGAYTIIVVAGERILSGRVIIAN